MNKYKIPFNKPCLAGNEIQYISRAISKGWISGDGDFSRKCESWFEQLLGIPKALLTTSGTSALEMVSLLLELKPGDEVILPSFTFVSTANAFVIRGVKPVFIDIRSDTLNLDETKLESLITPKTKGIIVVHYAGVGCEMDAILKTAQQYMLPVIEDNALGLFGKYKEKYLGTFGDLSAQSFHETKNITCGEGGALFIKDPRFIERAEILREKGTNRSQFLRGEIDKYTWVDVGSSYVPSDILAAFLYAQLENLKKIQEKRRWIWNYYYKHLKAWASETRVRLPCVPEYGEQAYSMFYILMPSQNKRQALIDHLREKGILAVFHYLPLHLSTMGRKLGGKEGDCPVTEDVSGRLLRLPFYNELEEEDLELVVGAVRGFR